MKKTYEFVAVNGRPAASVSVTVYDYGTVNLSTLYSDSAGTLPIDNPVVTDVNGYYEFYAADGRYSLEYSGSAVVTRTQTDLIIDDTLNPVAADAVRIGAEDGSSGSLWTTVQGFINAAGINLQDYAALRAYAGTVHSAVQITGALATAQPQGIAGQFQKDTTDTTSGALFTGSITTTVLTVSAVTNGTLAVGQAINRGDTGATVAYITSLGTGAGGTGTYNLSASATVASMTMTADNSGTYLVAANGVRWKRQGADGKVFAPWFGADNLGVQDSSYQIQAAIEYAISSNIRRVDLGPGLFVHSASLNFSTKGIAFIGVEGSSDATGSVLGSCTVAWTGGALPMFTASTSRIRFAGFSVENRGTATDWLELNSGAQGNTYEDLYFILTINHTPFSRSVIRSNGNRLGYSKFKRIQATSPATVFLDIDGQGTSNGITPFSFDERCIINAVAAAAAFTFIKVTDENIEGISIRQCTFNAFSNDLVIFDSTTTPATNVCDYFLFNDNEIDCSGTDNAAYRFFKFTNVRNIAFDNNTLSCGGTKTYVADLVNSNVSSAKGIKLTSVVTALFNADATSTVRGVGYSYLTSNRPVFTTVSAGITALTYGASISIDGRLLDPSKHEILTIDVSDGAGHTINVDSSSPEFMTISQVFTVVIRNVSGGVIAASTFGATFNTSGATVAPATGFSRSYTFYWNGTDAIEISRGAADVAN